MKKTNLVLVLATGAALAGCAESNAPSGAVSLSFAGRSASINSAAGILASTSPTADELVLTKAEVVLRKIELESGDEVDCDDTPLPASCAEFHAGPLLVEIPTDPGAITQVTVQVPNGTYHELEFQIHKVSNNDPAVADFRAAHPEFIDKSIRVTGTFNGTPFTFETDVTAVMEMELDPPVVVTESTVSTNLTVNFSLDDWFRAADGSVIDPSTANKGGANELLVKKNIRRSLRAFEDRDCDGDEDDGHRGPNSGHDRDDDDDDSSGPGGPGSDSHGGHGSGGDSHS